jgi:hypothetical protein
MYYVAAAYSAQMPEKEIFRRLDPRNAGFMTVDIDMGSAGKLKIGLSHFYKSLVVATAKTYDNVERAMDGEQITMGEWGAPIMNLGRSRLSPYASMAVGLATGEDYLGNRISRTGSVAAAFLPASLHEPIAAGVDRWLGRPFLQTAEQNFTSSERESMSQSLAGIAFNILGINSYTEGVTQQINTRRDALAMETYGKAFKDIPDLRSAAIVAERVAVELKAIPKFRNPESLEEFKQKEVDRFIDTMDPRTRRYVMASGANGFLKVSGGIQTTSGAFVALQGLSRDENNKNAIKVALGEGLDKIFDEIEKDGINPVMKQQEIVGKLNMAVNAENKKLQALSGMKPAKKTTKPGAGSVTR